MPRSIRAKIMLLFMGGMTLIIALLVIFTAQQARDQYQMLYLERGETAAEDLSNRANHLFALGLRLDEFIGFEKQCNEIVSAHQGIAEVRLLDAHGQVAFRSSYPNPGPVIWIQRPLSKQPEASRGSVRVAVDRRLIDSQVRALVTRILIGGFLAMGLGTLLLMYVLNNNLGDPVRRLIRHIRETGPKHLQKSPKDLSDRGDELGTIALAFDDMAERLSSTQDALLNANQALSNHAKLLERRVEESTRELRNANRDLKTLANTDILTGLPNRLAFMTTLDE
ncbi:MAG: HAMP domain-containing protein, partial [Gammaproteobacteria bacterium]